MTPFFVDTPKGALFVLYWPPMTGNKHRAIVHVPAFADEMNKSRHMVALQARAMAEQGYAVFVLDLFGTGDSYGEFGEATWEGWLDNIFEALTWLRQQGFQSFTLWGLRLGALLAMHFASCREQLIDRLLLWQPVLNGDTFLTQFLRLRVASAMMNRQVSMEKKIDLKRQLLAGQSIEVAGYLLNSDLVTPLANLCANQLNLQAVKEVAIIEILPAEEMPISAASQQFLDNLCAQGVQVTLDSVIGDNFWASQEIVNLPNLIELGRRKVRRWR